MTRNGQNARTSAAQARDGGEGPLSGRTALVAGGTGNVGRYLVGGLLRAGATVVVPSRSEEKLEEVERLHDGGGRRVIPIQGDVTDPEDGPRIVREAVGQAGPFHGAVASLGGFVGVPSLLSASRDDLATAVEGYLMAHFGAARNLIPALKETGGSYVLINGPLAFDVWSPQTSVVSVATAAQSMLARALRKELEVGDDDGEDGVPPGVRVHELVIHSAVGWGEEAEKRSPVKPKDIGRFAAHLLSDAGRESADGTIHLRSPDQLEGVF